MLAYSAGIKGLAGVDLFLELGLALNGQDDNGFTPLHHALIGYVCRTMSWSRNAKGEKIYEETRWDGVPILKRLLTAGADPTIAENRGRTDLAYAKKNS